MSELASRTDDYLRRIGTLVRDARKHRGFTQAQLADILGTSQSAINRIERGQQNISVEMLTRVSEALDHQIVSLGQPTTMHLRVQGGKRLTGSIDTRTSKNAGVALLCASLLNSGKTILRRVARIDEVHRILEVLSSIGVRYRWLNPENDLELVPPTQLNLASINADAARRTRSIIMFLAPLIHGHNEFALPYAGGCDLGTRTIEPHLSALRPFGVSVKAITGEYRISVDASDTAIAPIVLTERGDTVTENAIMAAAKRENTTIIRNASSNYMVQDLCFYLQKLGVDIQGVGTTTLTITGKHVLNQDVDYSPSEDPIEAMSLITAAIVTESEITINRVPIEFLEIELAVLKEMGLQYRTSKEYLAANGNTRLLDLTIQPSTLNAYLDKIHPMPFPGLNIDNLPFFALIAACAQGTTMIHDWVYDNRAIYLTELKKLGARVTLMDPHRVQVEGPTHWSGTEVVCPPALRPAVVILLAMLAAPGQSTLRNINVIHRGYEQLAERLSLIGAEIEILTSG